MAVASVPATMKTGKAVIAIAAIASVEAIRRSAMEERRSQMLGRDDRRWRRLRLV